MNDELLRIQDLRVTIRTPRGPQEVLAGVDLAIAAGEIVALVGESGSGKSMTASAIVRMIPPQLNPTYGGSVTFRGTDLLTGDEKAVAAIRGHAIAPIFQSALTALDPSYRIGTQMLEIIMHRRKCSRGDARTRALGLLGEVGLDDPARVFAAHPHQLSGGQRQRVLIANALACEPALIIADEPTSALDATVQRAVLDLFSTINARVGTALLLITHDFGVVAHIADRVAVMYAGRVVEEGTVSEVMFAPAHPYSQALVACVPELGWLEDGRPAPPLKPIVGEPPATGSVGSGCAFAPRCPQADGQCAQPPPLVTRNARSSVRCWKRDPMLLEVGA
jgi:oligopeptide/dipeptide ABC transporter ATP-binding protein